MTDTKPRTIFILLPLLMLACTLTAKSAAVSEMPLPEQTATAKPTQTLAPAPLTCHVKTGIESGALNLRACGGTDCPIANVLHEGETLTRTESKAVDEWMEVITAGGLSGWVNSNYLDCPAENAGLK